jgi:hypothetical protein
MKLQVLFPALLLVISVGAFADNHTASEANEAPKNESQQAQEDCIKLASEMGLEGDDLKNYIESCIQESSQ